MRRLLSTLECLLVVSALTACGSTSSPLGTPAPSASRNVSSSPSPTAAAAPVRSKITIGGRPALSWGTGPYGVVLAHGSSYDAASWDPQGPVLAARGATVVAVEDISPSAIFDAVKNLQSRGIKEVALVGGSAGADAVLEVARQHPGLADQLVLLSPNRVVDGLGSEPKLVIASAEEPRVGVARELAATAPGEDNVVEIVPGRAHAQAILKRDANGAVLRLILRRLS